MKSFVHVEDVLGPWSDDARGGLVRTEVTGGRNVAFVADKALWEAICQKLPSGEVLVEVSERTDMTGGHHGWRVEGIHSYTPHRAKSSSPATSAFRSHTTPRPYDAVGPYFSRYL